MALAMQHLDQLEDMVVAVSQNFSLEMDKLAPEDHTKALVDISVTQ